VLPLTEGVAAGEHSPGGTVWRMYCLLGLVSMPGVHLLAARKRIKEVLTYALSHKDDLVFRCGCEVLWRTMLTLTQTHAHNEGPAVR
jgi:hypothetical protein